MTAISFFCPYEVKGKGNSKMIVRSKSGRTFLIEPAQSKRNAQALCSLFVQHRPAMPLEGPVRVTYQIQYAWRKGESQKRRKLGMLPKDTAPDLGQLEKQLDDVLEAAGFIVNDSQIAARGDTPWLRYGKFWCDRPGVHVWIEPLFVAGEA